MTDSTNNETKDDSRGGNRKGAGRPRQHPDLLKVPFRCSLPSYVIEFLREHKKSQPALIEEALLVEHAELRDKFVVVCKENTRKPR